MQIFYEYINGGVRESMGQIAGQNYAKYRIKQLYQSKVQIDQLIICLRVFSCEVEGGMTSY
jgi:hypothetical protein